MAKYQSITDDQEKRDYNLSGLAFPAFLDNRGRFAESYVDIREGNYEKIKENVRQIIMTRPGQRAMRPEFGGNYFEVFAQNTVARRTLTAKDIERAIERWEPRVNVLAINPLDPTPQEEQTGIARTELKIRIKRDKLVATITRKEKDNSVNVEFEE